MTFLPENSDTVLSCSVYPGWLTQLSFSAPFGNRTSIPQRLPDTQEIPLKILPLLLGTWSLYWNPRHRERDEGKTKLAVISQSSKSAGFPLASLTGRLELLSNSFVWELLGEELWCWDQSCRFSQFKSFLFICVSPLHSVDWRWLQLETCFNYREAPEAFRTVMELLSISRSLSLALFSLWFWFHDLRHIKFCSSRLSGYLSPLI